MDQASNRISAKVAHFDIKRVMAEHMLPMLEEIAACAPRQEKRITWEISREPSTQGNNAPAVPACSGVVDSDEKGSA